MFVLLWILLRKVRPAVNTWEVYGGASCDHVHLLGIPPPLFTFSAGALLTTSGLGRLEKGPNPGEPGRWQATSQCG